MTLRQSMMQLRIEAKSHKLETKSHKLEVKSHKSAADVLPNPEQLEEDKLPKYLEQFLLKLGKKAPKPQVKEAIIALCGWKELSAAEIAYYLKRKDKNHLFKNFLAPMIEEGTLIYKYPQMPRHPHQAYRVKQEEVY